MNKIVSGVKSIEAAFIAINLASALAVVILLRLLPPIVPLLYGSPQGEEQLAQSTLVVLLPIGACVFVALNYFITFVARDKFIRHMLLICSGLITFLVLFAVLQLFLLVGRV